VSPLIILFICLAAFLILMFISVPIAVCFGIVGLVGVTIIRNFTTSLNLFGNAPLEWASMEALIVVPLFILMGEFAFRSEISTDLFDSAVKWMGRLPGGITLATMLACTGFAACTGSSLASAATMGTVAWPEMQKHKYSPELSTGCIAAGGTLGILIPPSITFVIYGGLTQTSVGKLFIGGLIPGLMLAALFMLQIYLQCRIKPSMGPPGQEKYSLKEKFKSLVGIWGMVVLVIIVLGGMYLGVLAPSEAGALGAFGALVIALIRRRLTMQNLIVSLRGTVRLTSMILSITIGAMIFNFLVTVSGFSGMFSQWIHALPVSPWFIVIFTLILYIPLGMFMDTLAMILLTIPVVFPILMSFGFDPVWFGVLLVIMCELGMITPPVGMNVFVTSAVTKIPLEKCFRGILPFAVVMCIAVIILCLFPQIATFLPNRM
jgi:C4-dicarboxylate transporter, DctM subunit